MTGWSFAWPLIAFRQHRYLYSPAMRPMHSLWILPLLSLACAHQPAGTPDGIQQQPATSTASAQRLLAAASVDAGKLNQQQQQQLVALAREQRCPCPPNDESLLDCAGRAGSCPRAAFAVRAVARGLARDEPQDKISSRLIERFGPREPEQVDLTGAPCRGAATARVTLVLFSDFQCPFCSRAVRLVHDVERAAGARLRVCFKHWPLKRHPLAEGAARAAVAAQRQGKFWAMHDRLFANQKELEPVELVQHARELGLDLERFKQDLALPEVKARVAQDRAEARRLKLSGTPFFLINGRRMTDRKTVADFLDWIAEAEALSAPAAAPPAPGR